MRKPLLSIAIPTYNRESLLNRCLDAITAQLTGDLKNHVELIVSDNASADDTTAVVQSYVDAGFAIKYIRNTENQGPDKNIAQCFMEAHGKYVWIFSDDDFLMPGYLPKIVELLAATTYGAIYINGAWFTGDIEEVAAAAKLNYRELKDPMAFINAVNYWTTFITGNITNKELFTDQKFIDQYLDTNLVQLSWILPAIFKSSCNLIIDDKALACREENTGGYKLFNVFGRNFNLVMKKLIKAGSISRKTPRVINRHLLNGFFPMFINRPLNAFGRENPVKTMLPVFWTYRSFWVKVFPDLFKGYYLKKNYYNS